MPKTDVVCEAFSVGQKVTGIVLIPPFYLSSLFMPGGLAPHGWGNWTMEYLSLVVLPVAACLSAAMAAGAAPAGQQWSYARSTAFGYMAMLLGLALLLLSLSLYACWPFTTGQQAWQSLSGSRTSQPIPMLLGGTLLFSVFAALGCIAGRSACYRPRHMMARFLRFCWRLSRKQLSEIAVSPLFQ